MSGWGWRKLLAAAVALGGVVSTATAAHADEWDYVYGSAGPLDYSEYLDVIPLPDGSAFLIGAYSGNFEGMSAGVSYRMFAQYRSAAGAMVWTSEIDPSLGGCTTTPTVHASGADTDGVAYVWVSACDTRGIASMSATGVIAFTPTLTAGGLSLTAGSLSSQFGVLSQGVVYVEPGDRTWATSSVQRLVHLDAQLDVVVEHPLPAPFDGRHGGLSVPSIVVTDEDNVWVAEAFKRPLPHLNDYLGLLRVDMVTGATNAIQHFGYGCFDHVAVDAGGATILRAGPGSVWVSVCRNADQLGARRPIAVAFDPTDGHLLGDIARPEGWPSMPYADDPGPTASRSGDWVFEAVGRAQFNSQIEFRVWRVDGEPGSESLALARAIPYDPADVRIGAADGIGDDEFIVAGATRSGAAIDLQAAAQGLAAALGGRLQFTTHAATGNFGAFAMRAPIGTPGIVTVPPARILDTRAGQGLRGQELTRLRAGETNYLSITGADLPFAQGEAAGVVLTVTAVNPAANGYVTIFPCTSGPIASQPRPNVSSVNYAAGVTTPNTVFAKLGLNDSLCFFSKEDTDLIFDLNGYLPKASLVATVAPQRITDTRQTGQRIGAEQTFELAVAGQAGVPGDAAGAIVNLTAVNPSGPGYLTAFPCGSERPKVSNVNWSHAGAVVSNAAFVKIGNGGKVCFFAKSAVDLVVDVNGYSVDGPGVVNVDPFRAVDTRETGARLAPESQMVVPLRGVRSVGGDATGVILNVTAVAAGGPGFLTVFPCGGTRPTASNVNYTAGQTVASSAVVKLSESGDICVFSKAAADVIVDVNGYLTD